MNRRGFLQRAAALLAATPLVAIFAKAKPVQSAVPPVDLTGRAKLRAIQGFPPASLDRAKAIARAEVANASKAYACGGTLAPKCMVCGGWGYLTSNEFGFVERARCMDCPNTDPFKFVMAQKDYYDIVWPIPSGGWTPATGYFYEEGA
jgi:hypothetical protein